MFKQGPSGVVVGKFFVPVPPCIPYFHIWNPFQVGIELYVFLVLIMKLGLVLIMKSVSFCDYFFVCVTFDFYLFIF